MNPLQTSRCIFVFFGATLAMAQQPGTPASPAPTPPAASKPVSADTVVLTVGSEKLTRAQFEDLLAALPENVRATANGPGRGKRLVDENLLYAH